MNAQELHGERTEDAPVTTNWNADEHEVEVGSEAWLRNVKASLESLQPPVSARERALIELEPLIKERRAAGCTPHQIAAILAANGVQVTGAALARRLREKDVEAKTPAKKKRPSSSLPS